MKTVSQPAIEVLRLEKDDPRNHCRMQLKIWKINNGTTVIMRLYRHDRWEAITPWGLKTWGEIYELILGYFCEWKVIKDKENWESAAHTTNELAAQDSFLEEGGRDSYMHFCWYVKPHLIDKF